MYIHIYIYIGEPVCILCRCVSCVGRAPCVGRSLCLSGAFCVGALCVGRSLVGPSPPVSVSRYVDIRSRDGSRSSARPHGWYHWSHGEPGGRRAGPRPLLFYFSDSNER